MNNLQNIKVSDALKKGRKILIIPINVFIIFFFLISPAILLYYFRNDKNSIFLIIGGISSIVLGIVLPIIWWSINVIKYKIWASNNVKEIHRFYAEAQTKKLIIETPFFKKLEIKSAKQKEELEKFYKRLNEKETIVRDINNSIETETFFKSKFISKIIIFLTLIASTFYLFQKNYVDYKMAIGLGIICTLLILFELYKGLKYNFILKVSNKTISYKDDKIVIPWKDVINYKIIPGIKSTPSRLIIETHKESNTLILEGFRKIRLNKVIDVLNENKHRFKISQLNKNGH